jgi:hypothetical protein
MIDNTGDALIIAQANSIVKRYDLVNYIINKNGFKDYLEIGVAYGDCIRRIEAPNKDGVDPVVESTVTCPEINYKMGSNEFFALPEISNKKYDVIFIDGLHHSDQVDIDIKNSLEHLNEGGFIFLHDCNPPSYESQLVPRVASAWNGDVWKSIVKLRHLDIDLDISVIDTDFGVGIITKGKNHPIDGFILEESLEWDVFISNRKYFLNLLEIDEFFDKYSY